MGISNLVAASSGLSTLVKSIQRGSASSAGNITISSVVTSKTVVNSFSTGAAGSAGSDSAVAAANGTTSAATSNSGSSSGSIGYNSWARGGGNSPFQIGPYAASGPFNSVNGSVNANAMALNMNARNIALNSQTISGGTSNIVSANHGAYLADATTLTVTGPCRYEIVEYF